MNKLRVFVSSVQKELEPERVAVASLITTDPFLMQHCLPVLFEKEPIPPRPANQPYLKSLRGCQIYVLVIFNDYGPRDGDFSATHHEYRLAQKLKLPTLVFLKGKTDDARNADTKAFLSEIKQNKHTYCRFVDREDLKPEMRRALLNLLKQEFNLEPSADEAAGGREMIEAASPFETAPLPNVPWKSLDESSVAQFAAQVIQSPGLRIWDGPVCEAMHTRGLLWRRDENAEHYATAAGLLLFGKRPADSFPQCEILVDAYAGTKISGKPRGQLNINAPIPVAIEKVLEFVDKHTFHPTRVVGINNIALDGYFVATFPGPNGNYDRLKVPEGAVGLISPAIEARLNDRQKQIVLHAQEEGSVTRGWCVAQFKIANDTAGRDLKALTELGVLSAQGKGRAAHYVMRVPTETTGNQPT